VPNLINEIWEKRSLIFTLAFNDVKIRYRYSFFGFLWSFFEPLLMLGVLYVVFSNIFPNSIENFPIYLLLSLVIWYMFSRASSMGQMSLIDKSSILKAVYVRKELIVLSSCFTAFIMMFFEFLAFGFFLGVFNFVPPVTIIFLPLLLVTLFVFSYGLSLILSVITVYFRDVKFIWTVALQAGFFSVPIFYELRMLPENIQEILRLNPLVSFLEIAQNIVIFGTLPTTNSIIHVVVSTSIIFVIGYSIFRMKNKRLVENL